MLELRKLIGMGIALTVILGACGEDNGSNEPSAAETTEAPSGSECSTEEVTTDSGLKYQDKTCGDGTEAESSSTVVVHYVGTLEDGSEFDSSRERGEPATFSLDQVIPGFKEGITGMKEGGTRILTIPPELGYGESGTGGIPPNSTLIFEVELIEVQQA